MTKEELGESRDKFNSDMKKIFMNFYNATGLFLEGTFDSGFTADWDNKKSDFTEKRLAFNIDVKIKFI